MAFKNIKFKIQFFSLCLLGATVMSMSLITEELTMLKYILGISFWVFIILFALASISINTSRKSSRRFRKENPNLRQFGLISFFKNPVAKIVDIVMIANVIALIAVSNFLSLPQFVDFVLIGTLIISFGLHCILNGVNYIYLIEKGENK